MNRSSAIRPQRMRLTCWQSSAGCAAVGGKRAHGRLQIRHQQRRRNALADDVGDGEAEAVRGQTRWRRSSRRRRPSPAATRRRSPSRRSAASPRAAACAGCAALRRARAVRAARPCAAARPSSTSVRSSRSRSLVVPRLLDEVAHAAPHRRNREIDRAPAGHHDDREQAIDRLDPRDAGRCPRGPTSCRWCSSDPSGAGRTCRVATAATAASGDVTASIAMPSPLRSRCSASRRSD